jgi:hypothetical protein
VIPRRFTGAAGGLEKQPAFTGGLFFLLKNERFPFLIKFILRKGS